MKRICVNCEHWERINNGVDKLNVIGVCSLRNCKKKGGQKCHKYSFPHRRVVIKNGRGSTDDQNSRG